MITPYSLGENDKKFSAQRTSWHRDAPLDFWDLQKSFGIPENVRIGAETLINTSKIYIESARIPVFITPINLGRILKTWK